MNHFENKEQIKHGTIKFPFAYYYVNHTHSRYYMKLHWHKEYELIRVLKGSFNITINGKTTKVKDGDIIFLNGGSLHSGTPNNCIYECVVFEITSLLLKNPLCNAELNDLIVLEKKIQNFYTDKNSKTYQTLNNIFDIIKEKKRGFEFKIYGLLYCFLGMVEQDKLYISHEEIITPNKKILYKIEKILSFIENHYMEDITLYDMADTLNMNEKYFCRFFKRITQKTPIDYLNFYRIRCACEKIKSSPESLTDIAFDCGFNDASYFTKVFKKYNAMTPREYAKLYQIKKV